MNMYIPNLGFQIKDEDLKKLFEPFGEVLSAKVISDRETGRSRAFGFVEMKPSDEANNSMKTLNNKELEGRAVSVTVALERGKREFQKPVVSRGGNDTRK
ncbi:MAG: RNA-binding protein [Bacteroidetes bacterium]|nr:RNA-binding protein [Bacteroidota bacterium]